MRPRMLGAAVVCGLGHLAIALWVGLGDGPPAVDDATARWFHAHSAGALTETWRAVALVGGSLALGVVMLGSCAVAWRRAGPRWLAFLALSYGGVELLFWSMKAVIDRPRPPASLQLATVGSPSFPSGHTSVATAVAASLLIAASRTSRLRLRQGAAVALVALPVVVGVSRLGLGVHWLTDVVGGALLGLGWVLALAAFLVPARPAPAGAATGGVADGEAAPVDTPAAAR